MQIYLCASTFTWAVSCLLPVACCLPPASTRASTRAHTCLHPCLHPCSHRADSIHCRRHRYKEGLARFAVDSYEAPAADNLKNVHMHLTNYSLNRKTDKFKCCDDADGGDGSKRTVTSVFERLERTGRINDAEELWGEIASLTSRSFGVIQPILAGSRGRWSNACFQVRGGVGVGGIWSLVVARLVAPRAQPLLHLPSMCNECHVCMRWALTCNMCVADTAAAQVLGLDVLLDANGHPWLIEINDHPSLRVDAQTLDQSVTVSQPSPVDEAIKLPMLQVCMALPCRHHTPPHPTSHLTSPHLTFTSHHNTSHLTPHFTPPPSLHTYTHACMLQDAMRVVGELHGLHDGEDEAAGGAPPAARPSPSPPPSSGSRPPSGGFAYGTRFMEVCAPAGETRHLQLLARLRDIFELHSPSSSVFEATWGEATKEDARATSSAGPKWRAVTFARFLQSAGLVGGHRASAVAAGLSRPDADLLFTSVCGKGGTMDVLDFAEALARVAARLYPSSPGEAPSSPEHLISRLLARYFTASNGSSHGGVSAPASARAATAARAQAALKAATSRGGSNGSMGRKGGAGAPSATIEID